MKTSYHVANDSYNFDKFERQLTGTLGSTNKECYAEFIPIDSLQTDPRRFQNRNNAFSEASAMQVAENFDLNKFDPIVVWQDPIKRKLFVLSGHSRYEGLKRRGEDFIPVRYFKGSEAQAIEYARVDANRAATLETLSEDLKAYTLMRDGIPERNIKPAAKTELKRKFKGKDNKLEAWSYLDPAGLFIQTLNEDNRSEYPHIERFGQWVGELRKKHPNMTNVHETDIFNAVYKSKEKMQRWDKDRFVAEIEDRLLQGKQRLFPECSSSGCDDIRPIAQYSPHKTEMQELKRIQNEIDTIDARLKTTKVSEKIWTESERAAVLKVKQDLVNDKTKLQKDLGIKERAVSMFGVDFVGSLMGLGDLASEKEEAEKQVKKFKRWIAELNKRLETDKLTEKVWTPQERDFVLQLKTEFANAIKKLQKDWSMRERQPELFGR